MLDFVLLDILHGVIPLTSFGNRGIQLKVALGVMPWLGITWSEHLLNLFKGLVTGFGVGEVEVELNGTEQTHDAKDNGHLSGGVAEPGRDVETQSEVEEPVTDGIPVAGGSKLQSSAA